MVESAFVDRDSALGGSKFKVRVRKVVAIAPRPPPMVGGRWWLLLAQPYLDDTSLGYL